MTTPTTMFTLFPDLPTELQLRIWRAASEESRILEMRWSDRRDYFYCSTAPPITLQVCKRSRGEALKTFSLLEFKSNEKDIHDDWVIGGGSGAQSDRPFGCRGRGGRDWDVNDFEDCSEDTNDNQGNDTWHEGLSEEDSSEEDLSGDDLSGEDSSDGDLSEGIMNEIDDIEDPDCVEYGVGFISKPTHRLSEPSRFSSNMPKVWVAFRTYVNWNKDVIYLSGTHLEPSYSVKIDDLGYSKQEEFLDMLSNHDTCSAVKYLAITPCDTQAIDIVGSIIGLENLKTIFLIDNDTCCEVKTLSHFPAIAFRRTYPMRSRISLETRWCRDIKRSARRLRKGVRKNGHHLSEESEEEQHDDFANLNFVSCFAVRG